MYQAIIIFGNVGSDAGYWYLGADGKIHHVPGWDPETTKAFETIANSYKVLTKTAGRVANVGEKVAGVEHGLGMMNEAMNKEQIK